MSPFYTRQNMPLKYCIRTTSDMVSSSLTIVDFICTRDHTFLKQQATLEVIRYSQHNCANAKSESEGDLALFFYNYYLRDALK